jgi:hypothetical protein
MIGYESQKCMHPVHGATFWGVIRALQSDINICYPPPPVFISLVINEDLPGRAAAALDIYLYGGKEGDSYMSIPPGLLHVRVACSQGFKKS